MFSDDFDKVLFSACKWLIENGNGLLAKELSLCQIQEISKDGDFEHPLEPSVLVEDLSIILISTDEMYDIITEWNEGVYNMDSHINLNSHSGRHIQKAFEVASNEEHLRLIIFPIYGSLYFNSNWRNTLFSGEKTDASNQNPYSKDPLVYQGLRFNSPPEIEVAKALDALGVMYFANCIVRVGKPTNRLNRIPDFLICHKGKWGILEIDGKTYHTGRATDDYDRARLIEQHGGISYFTRYDAMRCQNDAKNVISEFLKILDTK